MKLAGFIDSHLHVLGLGYNLEILDLNKTTSILDIQSMIKDNLSKNIMIGRGWNQENLIEKRMLNKTDLNSISRDIPIMMTRVCGHVLTVNDKMLELAEITEFTKQIPGGHFDYETGIFSEKALELIIKKLPKPTREDLKRYFINANHILLENGITSVASDDFCIFPIPYETIIDVMVELYKEDKIQVRITEQVNLPFKELEDFIFKGYVNKQIGKLRMGPLKILADGSLGGKTAALKEPYQNEPNNFGIKTYTDEELFELIYLADKNGMDSVIHAIGDSTIEQVIHVLAKSINETKRYKHSHAIIHAQLATQNQIDLMKKYHIGAIIQPIFLNSDIKIVESRIGERAKNSYLFKSMYKKGIQVGFSTDSPIEPVSPLLNIYTALTRRSIKESDLDAFLLNERFLIEEAIECYTINNLRYTYLEDISENDYIILDRNISKCLPEELLTTKVLETYIDNKLVYRRG